MTILVKATDFPSETVIVEDEEIVEEIEKEIEYMDVIAGEATRSGEINIVFSEPIRHFDNITNFGEDVLDLII